MAEDLPWQKPCWLVLIEVLCLQEIDYPILDDRLKEFSWDWGRADGSIVARAHGETLLEDGVDVRRPNDKGHLCCKQRSGKGAGPRHPQDIAELSKESFSTWLAMPTCRTWHLSRLKGICQTVDHSPMAERSLFRALTDSWWAAYIPSLLSSANLDTLLERQVQVINVNDKKDGPKTDPWGTPLLTAVQSEGTPLRMTSLPPSCQPNLNPGSNIALDDKGSNLLHERFVRDSIEGFAVLPWGTCLSATPLLGASAGGVLGPALPGPKDLVATGLKTLEFRSRAKMRAPWLEKWVRSLWKRLSFPKKVAHASINLMLWVLQRDSRRRSEHTNYCTKDQHLYTIFQEEVVPTNGEEEGALPVQVQLATSLTTLLTLAPGKAPALLAGWNWERNLPVSRATSESSTRRFGARVHWYCCKSAGVSSLATALFLCFLLLRRLSSSLFPFWRAAPPGARLEESCAQGGHWDEGFLWPHAPKHPQSTPPHPHLQASPGGSASDWEVPGVEVTVFVLFGWGVNRATLDCISSSSWNTCSRREPSSWRRYSVAAYPAREWLASPLLAGVLSSILASRVNILCSMLLLILSISSSIAAYSCLRARSSLLATTLWRGSSRRSNSLPSQWSTSSAYIGHKETSVSPAHPYHSGAAQSGWFFRRCVLISPSTT